MIRSRPAVALLGLLSALLAVTAVWLLLHNPMVKSTSLGHYTCSAPYDTVLFDADNVPGGEPSPDADEVEARCIDAAHARFTAGSVAGAAALALAALSTVVAVRGQTTTKMRSAAQEHAAT